MGTLDCSTTSARSDTKYSCTKTRFDSSGNTSNNLVTCNHTQITCTARHASTRNHTDYPIVVQLPKDSQLSEHSSRNACEISAVNTPAQYYSATISVTFRA